MKTKSFRGVTVKDADQGIVTAVISTFGVIDHDGDVTSKSTFTDGAPIVVSAYGHTSWDGALPVGKGVLKVSDDECVAEMQFFVSTTHGRDAFLTVKELGDLQEWSYSLNGTVAHKGQLNGMAANFLDSTNVKEASPVLMGASIGTRTLSTKAASTKQQNSVISRFLYDAGSARWAMSGYTYVYVDDFDLDDMTAVFCISDWSTGDRVFRMVEVDFTRTDTTVTLGDTETDVVDGGTLYLPKSSKFSEHSEAALRGVKQLAEMAVQRIARRATEGKAITEQTTALEQLDAALAPWKTAIDTATQPEIDVDDALASVLARQIELTSTITI